MFWKKKHVVATMMDEYLKKAEECIRLFRKAFRHYLESGLDARFDGLAEETHIAESCCDDIRRRVEMHMYEEALIPEAREDILTLLEILDRVPNKTESILYMVQTESMEMPAGRVGKFRQLMDVNVEAFNQLAAGTRILLEDTSKVAGFREEIDKHESASDSLEREIVRSIFSSDEVTDLQKILLKELVIEIGSISDRCETASDTLTILAVKRVI